MMFPTIAKIIISRLPLIINISAIFSHFSVFRLYLEIREIESEICNRYLLWDFLKVT